MDSATAPAIDNASRPAWLARIYLLLGLLGVLPLIVLTPPFQVPDEQQHFLRAYQLSEGGLYGVVRGDVAGAELPSSLTQLVERFLGSRAAHARREVRLSRLSDTLQAWGLPLDPSRREFVEFGNSAFYSPLPYLPQVSAIAAGRAVGLGPLGLLYATRLANGVAAVLVVAAALRLLPVGGVAMLVLGLLPMTLFEFASASPDAAVIASAYLFTAVAMRCRIRRCWTVKDVLVAVLAGAVFCSLKPNYAPIMLLALPAALRAPGRGRVLLAHAVVVAVVLGITVGWLRYSASVLVLPSGEVDLPRQLAGVLSHPVGFAGTLLHTLRVYGGFWLWSGIGILGWLTVPLPAVMYAIPILALAGSLLLPRPMAARMGFAEACWQAVLVAVSAVLVLLALYLYFTPLGLWVVLGVQGRYFLPVAGLAVVALAAWLPLPRRDWPALRAAVVSMMAVEVVLTSVVVARAYQVL